MSSYRSDRSNQRVWANIYPKKFPWMKPRTISWMENRFLWIEQHDKNRFINTFWEDWNEISWKLVLWRKKLWRKSIRFRLSRDKICTLFQIGKCFWQMFSQVYSNMGWRKHFKTDARSDIWYLILCPTSIWFL